MTTDSRQTGRPTPFCLGTSRLPDYQTTTTASSVSRGDVYKPLFSEGGEAAPPSLHTRSAQDPLGSLNGTSQLVRGAPRPPPVEKLRYKNGVAES